MQRDGSEAQPRPLRHDRLVREVDHEVRPDVGEQARQRAGRVAGRQIQPGDAVVGGRRLAAQLLRTAQQQRRHHAAGGRDGIGDDGRVVLAIDERYDPSCPGHLR